MVAVGAFDDAGIADLVVLKAPVLKVFDHLTRRDVLIAGRFCGRAVFQRGVANGGKRVLRVFAGLILGKQLFRFGLGLCHSVFVRRVGNGDQDVADVRQRIVVGVAGFKDRDVVRAVRLDAGSVAGLAAGIKEPVGELGLAVVHLRAQGVAVVGVAVLGVLGSMLVGRGNEGLVALFSGVQHLVGSGLLELGEFLLVGLVEQAVGHVEHAVVNGVIGVGVSFVFAYELVVGIGGLGLYVLGITGGEHFDGEELTEVLLVAARAVHGGDIAVDVGVAVEGGVGGEIHDGRVDVCLIVLGKGRAVGDCRVVDGKQARRALQALLREGIGPGDAVFFVVVLLIERRVGVDEIAHHVAVLAAHGVVGFLIEIVHHGGGQLVAANGRRGRVTGQIAAGQHGEKRDDGNYQYKADDADGPFQTLAHTLFLGYSGGFAGSDLLLALVLFARCAHFRIIPLVYSCFARRRHSTYYTEKAAYMQAFLSEFIIFSEMDCTGRENRRNARIC